MSLAILMTVVIINITTFNQYFTNYGQQKFCLDEYQYPSISCPHSIKISVVKSQTGQQFYKIQGFKNHEITFKN